MYPVKLPIGAAFFVVTKRALIRILLYPNSYKMDCPNCFAKVPPENINIQTDIAQCAECHNIFKISEHVEQAVPEDVDIDNPPLGAWVRNERHHLVIGATTRSYIAFFLVPFMLVWSGGSLGGIYGGQILSGEFNILMSLFGIPFIIGSVIFWSLALMSIAGKVEVSLDELGGKIFTGVGSIGYRQKFSWDEVSSVKEKTSKNRNQGTTTQIVLEGKKRYTLGYGLSESRRYFMYMALKMMVYKMRNEQRLP